MPALKTVYIMAFTPRKMDDKSLIGMCRTAGDMLSAKDKVFASRMALVEKTTPMHFSNQIFIPTMHDPQRMTATMGGWMKNQKVSFIPMAGDTFFPHGMRDSEGEEHFVLFYFVLA